MNPIHFIRAHSHFGNGISNHLEATLAHEAFNAPTDWLAQDGVQGSLLIFDAIYIALEIYIQFPINVLYSGQEQMQAITPRGMFSIGNQGLD